jgi:two-component system cell cycle sensor histidine kinase/response regulator CckA
MYVQLIKDVALLIALSSLYSMFARLTVRSGLWRKVLPGLLFGGVAVVGMVLPFQLQPGVFYDGRSIILALSGLFGGTITSLVASVVAGAYRASLGGAGVWAGLASIVGPALVGLAFRRASGGRPDRLGFGVLYALGVAAHVVMLACQLLVLPWPAGIGVIQRIWLPIMIIFPVATVLIGLLLQTEEKRALAEDRFKHVFESANVGKSITLPTGEINANAAFCAMLGYASQELQGRRWQDVTPPEDVAEVQRQLDTMMNGEKDAARLDKRYVRKDGSYLWADVSMALRRDSNGRPLHFITTAVDITARHRAEEVLRERESRYRTLFGESPVAIWEMDLSGVKARFDELRRAGVTDLRALLYADPAEAAALAARVRVLEVNRRSVELFGAASVEDLSREVHRHLAADSYEAFKEELAALFEGKRSFSTGIADTNGRGEPIQLDLTLSVPADHANDLASVLISFVDVTERRRGEEALAVSEANLHSLIASTDDIIVSRDRDGRVVAFNAAFASIVRKMFGVGAAPGMRTEEHLPAEERAQWEGIIAKVLSGEEYRAEFSWKIDGGTRHYDRLITPIRVGSGIIGCAEYTRDITERRRTEEQLRQALKMETVGQLAGGVAHDFNNMLQVIFGSVEMALRKVEPRCAVEKHLLEVRRAAQRSADLTGQLLAFARRQTVSPRVVDLNDVVANARKMIQRLIGEDIEFVWVPALELGRVMIDPAQVDQVLANLAVNARDAIGGVGGLTVETGNVVLDQAYCAEHPGAEPGEYVQLAVSDDGHGMDRETMSHLFEPFFTTKGLGKGTGLGLATIYGIVKQNKGFIDVVSEPGKGTTFRVYLPRASGVGESGASEATQEAAPRGGTETLLVVEDEEAILALVHDNLEGLGYTVLAAKSPEEALRTAGAHAGPLDLLITDVVLPQMNGRELWERLAAARPGLRCLFMSGYPADVIAHRGVLDDGVRFVAKPFTLSVLAEKVRDTLGAGAGAGSA